MEIKYKGQSSSELHKNFIRVKDIVSKSDGDIDKMRRLSQTQANRITDECKALNRAMAAKELGYKEIFEIFFERAYVLGAVDLIDFRDYRIAMLLGEDY